MLKYCTLNQIHFCFVAHTKRPSHTFSVIFRNSPQQLVQACHSCTECMNSISGKQLPAGKKKLRRIVVCKSGKNHIPCPVTLKFFGILLVVWLLLLLPFAKQGLQRVNASASSGLTKMIIVALCCSHMHMGIVHVLDLLPLSPYCCFCNEQDIDGVALSALGILLVGSNTFNGVHSSA